MRFRPHVARIALALAVALLALPLAADAATPEQEVVTLVNAERAKIGLPPLVHDAQLSRIALLKARDLYDHRYFSHFSPTYGSPFDMLKRFGVAYAYAGENIAKGYPDAQSVMAGWMASAGHRQNILHPAYDRIGVAHYHGIWVQLFTGDTQIAQQVPAAKPPAAAPAPRPLTPAQVIGKPTVVPYIVKRGDTLYRIARAYRVPLAKLIATHPQIQNPNRIFAGQIVYVPAR